MKEKSNTFGISAMVCGILGLMLFLAPYFGLPLAILSVIFYAIQKKRYNNGISLSGLVLGIIGIVMNSFMLLFVVIAIMVGLA